jgi:hypothetical protein
MSSSRHPTTDELMGPSNNTFQQLLRYFCCYDGTVAYNATRTLGIEHSPFEANFGYSHEEPHDLLFSMRPSISVSQEASERFRLLQEIHVLARSVF